MAISDADYIVVGAGLTGCVIAHRLAVKGNQVLVLEAGQDPAGNPDITTPLGGFALLGTELDWAYKTLPQHSTAGRVHTVNAGKALGGGTTVNYGGWLRGDRGDFDAWADMVNDARWSYEGLLPWFRKSENYSDLNASKRQHGFDGPVRVTSISRSDPKRRYPLRDAVREAWLELGIKPNQGQDAGLISGIAEIYENISDEGQRQPAHLAYPLSELAGLRVLTGATAAKVLFNGTTAYGIELSDSRCFEARREIILCAGALRTPQILALSGIGPPDTLAKYGISLVHGQPAVGENLHDHFALYMAFRLKDSNRGLALGRLEDPAFFKGLPYDWVINELEKNSETQRKIQDEAATSAFARSLLTYPRPLVENFTIYASAGIPGIPDDGTHIASSTMIATPTSRGTVSISSASVTDPPVIDSRYLTTEVDRGGLVHASRRMLQAMLTTDAMKDFIEAETPPTGSDPALKGLLPLTPDATDEQILDRIQRSGAQHHHSGGTAAMGTVVDTEGRVKGVEKLRVADASVIPIPIGGHPQSTLYAVAEQLASMIAGTA